MAGIRPVLGLLVALTTTPQPAGADPLLADFDYLQPVHHYDFQSQGQSLSMAFMDVRPEQPNGRTIVLLHGKNFCAATWEASIDRCAMKAIASSSPIKLASANQQQAASLSVQPASAGRQYTRPPRRHWRRAADHAGAFDGWHACLQIVR